MDPQALTCEPIATEGPFLGVGSFDAQSLYDYRLWVFDMLHRVSYNVQVVITVAVAGWSFVAIASSGGLWRSKSGV